MMPNPSYVRTWSSAAAVAVAVVLGVGAAPASRAVSLDVPGRSSATPWVASAGSFVAVAWGASAGGKADVFVAVSRDGGATFGAPVQVNSVPGEARLGGERPPRVALVSKGASSVPEIVVLWTARGDTSEIKMARSRDGGRTFEPPVALQSAAAAGERGWAAMSLDGRGAAHAIWLDHRMLAARRASDADHQSGAHDDGVAMAQNSALYYASVGRTPSGEREIARGVCYCCKTAMAIGPDGAIYAAWRHVYPGNLRDIALTVSRDEGRSFSAPVRVSADGWAINGCPDDGPAMAVDQGGTVHLVWPTVVEGPDPEGALFYASTRNGRTFTRRTRIPTLGSLKPSHPQIVVDRGGRVFVAWDENVTGRRVAAARELKVSLNQHVSFGDVITIGDGSPAMYPVLAATRTGLVAVWTTGGEQSSVRARAIRFP